MSKYDYYNQLEKIFNSKFNIENYKKFVREFLNIDDLLPTAKISANFSGYEKHINTYTPILNFLDENSNGMFVAAVELTSNNKVERARVLQRNFISSIIHKNTVLN